MIKQLCAVVALCASAVVASAQAVYFEGSQVGYGADRPYVSRGTLMLPARDTMERIGGALERSENGQRIHLTFWENKVNYRQGERFFMLNRDRVALPVASKAREGVLYLPIQVFRSLTDGRLSTTPGGSRPGGGGAGRPRPDGGWDWDGRSTGMHVVFNNRRIEFDGNEAMYRKDGTLMVPFRSMGDAIGADTDRTADGLRVWINYSGNRVEYDKGHIWFRINGRREDLDTVSDNRNGVLFVPVDLFVAVTNGRLRVR